MNFNETISNGYMIPTSVAVGSGEATDIRCVCDTVEDFKTFLDTTDMELRYEGLVTYEKVNKLLKVYKGNDTWQTIGEGGENVDTSSFITLTQLSQQLSNYYTKAQTDNKISEEIAKAQLGGSGEVDLSAYATKTYVDDEISKIELKEGPQGPKGDKGERGEQGLQGISGATPSISIGNVNTLESGQNATVTRRGTDTNPIFDFGIPRGASGSASGVASYDLKWNRHKFIANPLHALDIKTFSEGKNQPTHPSVKYFESGFGGYKYWMAYTPFPNNNNEAENPCITYSNDGYTWLESGINNPIELMPTENGAKVGYNSDTHLVYANGRLECWWRTHYQSGSNANHEVIYRKISANGKDWGEKEELFRVQDPAAGSALSPTILYEEGKYKIWICHKQQVLKYYESQNGDNWQFIRDINVDNDDNTEYKIWHFDIIHTEKGYEFVGCYHPLNNYNDNKYIYYASSTDNITYSERKLILSTSYSGQFDGAEVYRPSICYDGSYKLYYGAKNSSFVWSIGLVEVKDLEFLSSFFDKNSCQGEEDSSKEDIAGLKSSISVLEKALAEQQKNINDIYKMLENGGDIIEVESVTLSNQNITIAVGETIKLEYRILPTNATNKSVSWEASNDNASIDSTGILIANNAGECTITCKSNSNESKYSVCNVTITEADYVPSDEEFINNLFDYSVDLNESTGYYSPDDGSWTSHDSIKSTKPIEISSNTELMYYGLSACFFNESMDFIGSNPYSGGEYDNVTTSPVGAKYISFALEPFHNVKIVYLCELPLRYSNIEIGEDISKDNINTKGYYDGTSGEFTESTQYYCLEKTKVTPGMKFNIAGGNYVSFYNKSKKICSGIASGLITVPNYAEYMSVSFASKSMSNFKVIRTE